MSEWYSAGTVSDIAANKVKYLDISGREIALFQIGSAFFAIDNSCPHRGGPLFRGAIEGSSVRCPLHGWLFDIPTGECKNQPGTKINSYPVKIENESVYICF